MALSRKHFEAIAGILNKTRPTLEGQAEREDTQRAWIDGQRSATMSVALQLANYFSTENPNFDRQRFLKAAGVS